MPTLRLKHCLPVLTATALVGAVHCAGADVPAATQNLNPRQQSAHGKDERVYVQAFFTGQEYPYELVKQLSGGRWGLAPAPAE